MSKSPLLYQHDDGRNLVALPGSTTIAGDPSWHRCGPVEVETAAANGPIHVGGELAQLNCLLAAIPPLCRILSDIASTCEGADAAVVAIEACVQCARISLGLAMAGVDAMEMGT